MPHNLSISRFQFLPPAERHYNSDLSIWLSVDPMADKYPSTSPYTYCANNPVRLVDPNGRAWKTADDETKANDMIKLAQLSIVKNTRLINILKFFVPKSNAREFLINELEERNSYLSEGIEGLQNMGSNTDYLFHFKSSEDGGYVEWGGIRTIYKALFPFFKFSILGERGTIYKSEISILGDDLNTFWHESKHIQDWLSGVFDGQVGLIFGLITKTNGSKVLGTARTEDATPEQLNQYKQAIERSAYRSEFAFDPSDFFNGQLKPAFWISHINGDMGIYDN